MFLRVELGLAQQLFGGGHGVRRRFAGFVGGGFGGAFGGILGFLVQRFLRHDVFLVLMDELCAVGGGARNFKAEFKVIARPAAMML